MALCTHGAKFDLEAHGTRCARTKAVHHAVGISRQRNSGYMVVMAQGLYSFPLLFPPLALVHVSL